MKAITLYQPWASLIAVGAKRFETRSWETSYRGPIAIHAGKKPVFPWFQQEVSENVRRKIIDILAPHRLSVLTRLPLGAVIAMAELVECWTITHNGHTLGYNKAARIEGGIYGGKTNIVQGNEIMFGDWTPGRYAWELANVIMLPAPVKTRGQQRLWDWKGSVA